MTMNVPAARPLTRRSFMAGAVAAGAGALVAAGCASGTSRSATATTVTGVQDRPDPGAARRVVVVGAGLAGLTAALDLRDAAWDVVVLEARDRVGGRVHTLRGNDVGGPFRAGLHAEAGGESIDDNHDQLQAALRRFGLATETRDPNRQNDGMVIYQGAPVALATFAAGRGGAIAADYARASTELEKLAAAHSVDPEHPEAARDATTLDGQSLSSFFDGLSLVPEARFLVEQAQTSSYASDLTQVSLLFALQQAVVSAGVPDSAVETKRVAGGNDTLPTAMAAALGDVVVTGAPVQRIAETADGVAVSTADRTWYGAHVVLAVPAPPLRAVTFDPPLPAALAAAIEGLRLGPALKVITEFPTPFWKDTGRSGFSVGDAQYRVSWSPTDSYHADAGLLSSFTTGTHAIELAGMDEATRITRVQAQLAVPYPPPAGQSPTAAATMAWPNEPFTQGGYAAYAPGQMAAFWPALRAGTARLHIAGEHTEVLAGYMESAVRSGHRAATTIGRPA